MEHEWHRRSVGYRDHDQISQLDPDTVDAVTLGWVS